MVSEMTSDGSVTFPRNLELQTWWVVAYEDEYGTLNYIDSGYNYL